MKLFNILIIIPVIFIWIRRSAGLAKNSTIDLGHFVYPNDPIIKPEFLSADIHNKDMRYLSSKIQASRELIDEYSGTPDKDCEKFVQEQNEKLREKLQEILDILGGPIKEAVSQGTNADECVVPDSTVANDVTGKPALLLKKCVEDKVKQAKKIIEAKRREVDKLQKKLDDILAKMNDCDKCTGKKKEMCIKKVASLVEGALKEIPPAIDKANGEIKELILNYNKYLEECSKNTVPDAALTGESLINKVTYCLEQKYPQVKIKGKSMTSSVPITRAFLLPVITIIFIRISN